LKCRERTTLTLELNEFEFEFPVLPLRVTQSDAEKKLDLTATSPEVRRSILQKRRATAVDMINALMAFEGPIFSRSNRRVLTFSSAVLSDGEEHILLLKSTGNMVVIKADAIFEVSRMYCLR
jgi:hypothetical protein